MHTASHFSIVYPSVAHGWFFPPLPSVFCQGNLLRPGQNRNKWARLIRLRGKQKRDIQETEETEGQVEWLDAADNC